MDKSKPKRDTKVRQEWVASRSPFKRHVRELGLAVHEDSQVDIDQLF